MYLFWFSLTRHFKTITIRQHHSLLILKNFFSFLEINIGGVKIFPKWNAFQNTFGMTITAEEILYLVIHVLYCLFLTVSNVTNYTLQIIVTVSIIEIDIRSLCWKTDLLQSWICCMLQITPHIAIHCIYSSWIFI